MATQLPDLLQRAERACDEAEELLERLSEARGSFRASAAWRRSVVSDLKVAAHRARLQRDEAYALPPYAARQRLIEEALLDMEEQATFIASLEEDRLVLARALFEKLNGCLGRLASSATLPHRALDQEKVLAKARE
jgi:hypothetical protein